MRAEQFETPASFCKAICKGASGQQAAVHRANCPTQADSQAEQKLEGGTIKTRCKPSPQPETTTSTRGLRPRAGGGLAFGRVCPARTCAAPSSWGASGRDRKHVNRPHFAVIFLQKLTAAQNCRAVFEMCGNGPDMRRLTPIHSSTVIAGRFETYPIRWRPPRVPKNIVNKCSAVT